MSVSDAAVDFLDEFLRFGDSLAELPHHILVTLGVRVRHIVAKTDVAALHHAVEFRKLAYNLRIKIEDTAVVAECVFIQREATDLETAKREIQRTIPMKYGYNLDRTLDEIRPSYSFDVSCQGSVPEAIIAFLESISLEDCVRNAVSIGGDSDTIAAIACSIYAAKKTTEDEELMKRFEYYLPLDLMQIMEEFEARVGL